MGPLVIAQPLLKKAACLVIPADSTAPYLDNVHVVHGENGLAEQSKTFFNDALCSPAIMGRRTLLPPVVGLDGDFCIDESVVSTSCS